VKYKGKVEAGPGYFGALQAAANVKKMSAFERFLDVVERKQYGQVEYWYKMDRFSSKLLAFYMRPFNPRYLTHVTTTRGVDSALPESRRDDHYNALWTEFHENVHKFDYKLRPIRFLLGYAYPQILAAPFIVAATILAGLWGWLGLGALLVALHVGFAVLHVSSRSGERVAGKPTLVAFGAFSITGLAAFILGCVWGAGWWACLLAGAALFISPWPFKAKYRRDIELRGYTMTLYGHWLDRGSCGVSKEMIERFTGPSYFFMETNGQYVQEELEFQIARFLSDEKLFLKEWIWRNEPDRKMPTLAEPYRMARQFLEKEGMIGA
jgi:hypothetical protein